MIAHQLDICILQALCVLIVSELILTLSLSSITSCFMLLIEFGKFDGWHVKQLFIHSIVRLLRHSLILQTACPVVHGGLVLNMLVSMYAASLAVTF